MFQEKLGFTGWWSQDMNKIKSDKWIKSRFSRVVLDDATLSCNKLKPSLQVSFITGKTFKKLFPT